MTVRFGPRRVRQRQGRHSQHLGGCPDGNERRLREGETPATDRLCLLAGTRVPLPEATLRKLYPTRAAHETRVNQRFEPLVREGWFLLEHADSCARTQDGGHSLGEG
jgi:hypothetical protein